MTNRNDCKAASELRAMAVMYYERGNSQKARELLLVASNVLKRQNSNVLEFADWQKENTDENQRTETQF